MTNNDHLLINKLDQLIQINTKLAIINTNLNNVEVLNNELLQKILQELLDRRDEGKTIYRNGTVLSTEFTVIDTQIAPGHKVKGFSFLNTDKANSIFVAHDITKQPQIDADIVDTLKANPVFNQIGPGEPENQSYNTNSIKSIHLLAVTGIATYKMKLYW